MATTLKFKQGDSGTELNLNSTTTGFRLEEFGWTPVVATPIHLGDPPPVIETLNLFVSNTSYDNISSNMQSLHEMQVLADRYINDNQQEDPVWLHANMDGETGERRALVRSITAQYKHPWFGAGEATTNIPLSLTVVREPYWERTTARSLDGVSITGAACMVYDHTNTPSQDIVGDVGARVRFWRMTSATSAAVFWMGVRSANKHGATGITNFEEIWECEDGTNNASESGITDTVDATASGGNRVTLTETDLNWDDGTYRMVLNLKLSDISANEQDNFGKYLWLLRAKASAGSSTWDVKLQYSYHYSTNPVSPIDSEIVEVSGTSWNIYEMGLSPIGLRNMHALLDTDFGFSNETTFRVDIFARRTSGAADLHLDCLCPIPTDEGFCKVERTSAADTDVTIFGYSPEGTTAVMAHTNANAPIRTAGTVNDEGFRLPLGDGRTYIVASNTSYHDLNNLSVNASDVGKYYECWLSLRGSE
jgi:hypothetical protein